MQIVKGEWIMDNNEIKDAVQSYYGEIALLGKSCCIEESSCCDTSTDPIQIGVNDLISDADLGLGCGLPTQHAGLKPGETVLDLGSGAGVDVFRAAQAVGAGGYVIGVDMTPEMIARARENAEKAGYANVDFRQGDIENLPVEDRSIDVVLSNCVINLVPDKRRVFEEIYRVLKPCGRFSVSDIVTRGDIPDGIRRDMKLWAGCVSGALDRDVYLNLVEEAGFSSIEIQQYIEYDAYKGDDYRFASMTFSAVKT